MPNYKLLPIPLLLLGMTTLSYAEQGAVYPPYLLKALQVKSHPIHYLLYQQAQLTSVIW